MACDCNDKKTGGGSSSVKYVNLSKDKLKEWKQADAILGVNKSGRVFPVKKPEYELTKKDRCKLDQLVMNECGERALFDDGCYRFVYTQEEIDQMMCETRKGALEKLNEKIDGAVFYEADDTIQPRSHVVLNNGHQLVGKSATGGEHNLVTVNTDSAVVAGDESLDYRINSLTRPVVEAFDGTSRVVKGIAYKEEVDAVENIASDLNGKIDAIKESNSELDNRVTILEENDGDFVDLTTNQHISGQKSFQTDVYLCANLYTLENGFTSIGSGGKKISHLFVDHVGSSRYPADDGYFANIFKGGVEVATIDRVNDLESELLITKTNIDSLSEKYDALETKLNHLSSEIGAINTLLENRLNGQ